MTSPARDDSSRPQTAVYWFGNYHRDARNEAWHGVGYTEWDLVRHAERRFEGHQQPIVPQWGYTEDTSPADFDRAAAAAVDAGIDAFLVDWYWYHGPFLHRPLDEVILPSTSSLRFALMWANHDWVDVFPAPPHGQPGDLLAPAQVNPTEFRRLTQHVITRYMTSDRYWRVDGGAYYSIFRVDSLIDWFGGIEPTRNALEDFRARARTAGVGELHLAGVLGFGQLDIRSRPAEDVAALGLDSLTNYNWHDTEDALGPGPTLPYADWRQGAQKRWDIWAEHSPVPFLPNVSVGWDSTPRTAPGEPVRADRWPYLPVIVDNTPEELEAGMQAALRWLADRPGPKYLTINAWNEWTEGSTLEPDNWWGTGKLDALRRALRPEAPKSEGPRSDLA